MTDQEFWEHVFPQREYEPEVPDVWAISCARCGRSVEVSDPEDRERDAFCDECASESLDESFFYTVDHLGRVCSPQLSFDEDF